MKVFPLSQPTRVTAELELILELILIQGLVFINVCSDFSDPPLDPKYLTKRDDAIAIRGVGSTRSASPPVIQSTLPIHHNTRISQQLVVPKPAHPQPPPLASAYFPGQKGS